MASGLIREGGESPEASEQASEPTTVAHLQGMENEDHHAVIVEYLRVVISQDENLWFAQGLELDYAAAGDTLDDVKERFHQGLAATFREHLKIYGSVENLLKIAPQETWDTWLKADKNYNFTQVSLHDLADAKEVASERRHLPFGSIRFMEPALAAA